MKKKNENYLLHKHDEPSVFKKFNKFIFTKIKNTISFNTYIQNKISYILWKIKYKFFFINNTTFYRRSKTNFFFFPIHLTQAKNKGPNKWGTFFKFTFTRKIKHFCLSQLIYTNYLKKFNIEKNSQQLKISNIKSPSLLSFLDIISFPIESLLIYIHLLDKIKFLIQFILTKISLIIMTFFNSYEATKNLINTLYNERLLIWLSTIINEHLWLKMFYIWNMTRINKEDPIQKKISDWWKKFHYSSIKKVRARSAYIYYQGFFYKFRSFLIPLILNDFHAHLHYKFMRFSWLFHFNNIVYWSRWHIFFFIFLLLFFIFLYRPLIFTFYITRNDIINLKKKSIFKPNRIINFYKKFFYLKKKNKIKAKLKFYRYFFQLSELNDLTKWYKKNFLWYRLNVRGIKLKKDAKIFFNYRLIKNYCLHSSDLHYDNYFKDKKRGEKTIKILWISLARINYLYRWFISSLKNNRKKLKSDFFFTNLFILSIRNFFKLQWFFKLINLLLFISKILYINRFYLYLKFFLKKILNINKSLSKKIKNFFS